MSEKILVTWASSKIGKEFIKLIPSNIKVYKPSKKEWDFRLLKFNPKQLKIIKKSNKIVILHSIISNKTHLKKNSKELNDQININLVSIINICETALKYNPKVRIVILGSESGVKGSFDIIYALTKSSIHKYVEERKILKPEQQIVCIAPSTIKDGSMTLKRKDKKNVKNSIRKNPKKRAINSTEVSDLIYKLLFDLSDYISNTTLHMNGGKFSRM